MTASFLLLGLLVVALVVGLLLLRRRARRRPSAVVQELDARASRPAAPAEPEPMPICSHGGGDGSTFEVFIVRGR